MRNIAQEAGVNLAMINYYFGSKHKILETLIGEYFDKFSVILKNSFSGDLPLEDKMRRFIRDVVDYYRAETDLVIIALSEFPYDMPQVADFKVQRLQQFMDFVMADVVPSLEDRSGHAIRLDIVGPALIGMIFFHFMSRPVLERFWNLTLDDNFYRDYIREITEMALYGLIGHGPHD